MTIPASEVCVRALQDDIAMVIDASGLSNTVAIAALMEALVVVVQTSESVSLTRGQLLEEISVCWTRVEKTLSLPPP